MAISTTKSQNKRAVSRNVVALNPCRVCHVRELSVCAALTPDELDRLDALVTRLRLRAGQIVFQELDPADHVFNVTAGNVRLTKMLPDGRRQITGFLWPGDFLGLAFADAYAYTAEAVTPLGLCRFSRTALEALFKEMPHLERKVLSVASNELRAAQDQMLLLGRKTAREKLSSFLWQLRQRSRGRDDTLDLPMNRADIADYLGLTMETVSRTFTALAREGVLCLTAANKIVVREPGTLSRLAL